MQSTVHLDKKGSFVVPLKLRRQLGLEAGSLLLLEADGETLRVRKAVAVPVEKYTAERRAEFLLNNAMDAAEYREAVRRVRSMGLDPARIPHEPPSSAESVS